MTSSPTWEGLHERLRNAIQALIQAALEAEVTELLGRVRYQRAAVEHELYLHGLAEGDFDLVLRGLLGEEAPLSARRVARLKERWQAR